MFNKLKTAGNTVIEVLIATVIVAVVLTALAGSMTQSIHNSAEAEYRQIATRLGQDVMEVFRQDKNIYPWDQFDTYLTNGTTYCVPATLTTVMSSLQGYSVSQGIQGCQGVTSNNMTFNRAVTITKSPDPAIDSITVTVTVAWNATDATRKRDVELVQVFYKPD